MNEPQANNATSNLAESFVCIGTALVSDTQLSEGVEPSHGSLHDPTMKTKAFSRLDASTGYAWHYPPPTQGVAAFWEVISFVSMDFTRHFARPARFASNFREGVKNRLEEHGVMSVISAEQYDQRDALFIHSDVSLGSTFPFVCWVRSCFRAPRGAGTVPESTEKLYQSKAPAESSSRRINLWSRSHTPACCQSRRRRQQVMPLPQPISRGNFTQGIGKGKEHKKYEFVGKASIAVIKTTGVIVGAMPSVPMNVFDGHTLPDVL